MDALPEVNLLVFSLLAWSPSSHCYRETWFGTSTKCWSRQHNMFVLIYKSKFKNSVFVRKVLSAPQRSNIIQKQSAIMLLSSALQFMRSCLLLMKLDTLHFYKSFPETVPPYIKLFKVKILSFKVKINKWWNWVKWSVKLYLEQKSISEKLYKWHTEKHLSVYQLNSFLYRLQSIYCHLLWNWVMSCQQALIIAHHQPMWTWSWGK